MYKNTFILTDGTVVTVESKSKLSDEEISNMYRSSIEDSKYFHRLERGDR